MGTTEESNTTWQGLCPEGAIRYYEGDDPAGFRAEIQAEFGFDVTARIPDEVLRLPDGFIPESKWGEWLEFADGERFQSFPFFCPPEHLDAIYGSDRWPVGS